MSKRVVLIEHNSEMFDNRVHHWLKRHDVAVERRRPCIGETIETATDDIAATVIFGGPYNVYETDKHPFLLEEYRLIDACMDAGVPLLGICQGAQQIAHHLGAWAGSPEPARYEFGHYEILPSRIAVDEGFLTQPLRVTQAHYHTFDMPKNAVALASSDAFDNQAFRVGDNTYGFQFHAEQTGDGFRRWQDAEWAMFGQPGAQTRAQQDAHLDRCNAEQHAWFNGFLDRFLGPHLDNKKGGTE